MDLDGWRPDPYGIHEERLFAQGEPTPLVRDKGVGSVDALSTARGSSEAEGGVGNEPGQAHGAPVWISTVRAAESQVDDRSEDGEAGKAPAKPWFTAAASLIAAGVVVGLLGIAGVGRGGSAQTTTTLNPLARVLLNLPRGTTVKPAEHALEQQPTTTTESPIERALQSLPKSTTTVPTIPAPTTPLLTTTPSSTGPRPLATHVTQPAPHPGSTTPRPIVAATTLPLTTTTTSVGEADRAWYLAHGTIFNTLQTDIEKLDRTLASTSQSSYATVIPYWKELFDDAGQAETLPPIPDGVTQPEWASALGDLSEGATECIIGSAGAIGGTGVAVSIPPIYSQGSAFITTGTTQMDGAAQAVQSAAATASASSRSQVSGWYKSRSATFTTLQADINKVDAAVGSAGSAGYSVVDPDWQQLMSDARSALALPSVPDPYIENLWTTALGDLTQGSSDCLGSAEALPPNPFDQGVALIQSGTTYLSATLATVQSLAG